MLSSGLGPFRGPGLLLDRVAWPTPRLVDAGAGEFNNKLWPSGNFIYEMPHTGASDAIIIAGMPQRVIAYKSEVTPEE